MLSLLQNEIVVQNKWLTNAELADIIAISQMTPGPIAVNSATYVGYTVTGNVWGSLLTTFAVVLPSLTIMLAATKFYLKLRDNKYMTGAMAGMKPMILGMIGAAAAILITPTNFIDYKSWIIFSACFVLSALKFNPIYLIILSAVTGVVLYI